MFTRHTEIGSPPPSPPPQTDMSKNTIRRPSRARLFRAHKPFDSPQYSRLYDRRKQNNKLSAIRTTASFSLTFLRWYRRVCYVVAVDVSPISSTRLAFFLRYPIFPIALSLQHRRMPQLNVGIRLILCIRGSDTRTPDHPRVRRVFVVTQYALNREQQLLQIIFIRSKNYSLAYLV